MSELLVYDKAKSHTEGRFPDIDPFQACVHAGLYLGWACIRNLLSEEFAEDFPEEIEAFRCRHLTGPNLYRISGGVLSSDMLNAEGNAFTRAYYDLRTGAYLDDYIELLSGSLPTLYHVADTWSSFDLLARRIDARFDSWRSASRTGG